MTAAERTAALLRPWLGSDFVAREAELVDRLAFKLMQFLPYRQSLQALAQEVDSQLFMAVRNQTNGRMVLQMDGGQHIRVRVDDFAVMADELLYLSMEQLPASQDSFLLVQEYSMRHGSLSALKALYLLYPAFQTEEEYATVLRIIKTCHPPFRWRQWLNGA